MESLCCVERVSTVERLTSLGESWRRLELTATVPTVFVRFAWQQAWAQHFILGDVEGRELFVLAVKDGAEIVGIAPWYVARRRVYGCWIKEVRPIGFPETGADHLDILCRKGWEQRVAYAIAEALWDTLDNEWDLLEMHDMPAASPALFHFVNLMEEHGRQVDVSLGAFCPVMTLPTSTEEVVGQLGTRHREAYRRNLRALHRIGQVEHLSLRGGNIRERLEPLLQLHALRWPGHDQRFYPFLRTLLTSGADGTGAQIDYLLVDGIESAAFLHFDTGRRRELYLLGVDRAKYPKVNAGKALLGRSMEQAIEAGIADYDFLKGNESYKFDWTTGGERALNVAITRRRFGSMVSWCVTRAKSLARIVLR
jgi:CelD/BcsL family acetyltransferase involved in cellulose biosynthesis